MKKITREKKKSFYALFELNSESFKRQDRKLIFFDLFKLTVNNFKRTLKI